jgi:hypothetical protein
MLTGAVEIIGGAPARHIHPVHLARSQAADATGYILISYAQEPPAPERPVRKFHDLFMFRGPAILETVRFTRDLRFALHREAANRTFESYRHHPATRVSFYQTDARLLELLRSACHLLPSLKFRFDTVDGARLREQLASCPPGGGILEWSMFDGERPAMELQEVRSESEVSAFAPPRDGGKLLYYDLEENREFLRHALREEPPAPPAQTPHAPVRDAPPSEPSDLVRAADRLLRAFRQRAFEALGPRTDALLAQAEEGLRFAAPDFDSSRLTDASAPAVLELIERIVAAAPFWRRAPLRKAAETLLSDFYGKQYDLLERRGILGAVEQAYYGMKR